VLTEVEHAWGEMDRDATEATEVTRRLAVCNMDWDNVKAQDLFLLFDRTDTVSAAGGVIQAVKVR